MSKKKLRKPAKKTAKKTAKKAATKKAGTAVERKRGYHVKGSELRTMAARDYIFDPDKCSVKALYARKDRPYHDRVNLRTFEEWAYQDGWTPRRDEFWEEHEMRVMEAYRDQLLAAKLREIKQRTEERDAMSEWLRPRRDSETEEILRYPETRVELRAVYDEEGEIADHVEVEVPHPYAGLPVLNFEPGSFSQFVNAFVKFDQHLMMMRGEATSRTEQITRSSESERVSDLVDPIATTLHISEDDIHAMSRLLLRQRQPELAIDADWSEIDDGEEAVAKMLEEGADGED